MSVFVVAIHTIPLYGVDNKIIQALYEAVVGYAVPFFFIASGFLLEHRIQHSNEQHNETRIIWIYTNHIIKLYFIWTIAYLPITLVHFVQSGESIIKCSLQFLQGLFLIGEQYNSWPLWYLLSTIYALIAIAFLLSRKCKAEYIVLMATLLYLCMVVIDTDIIWSGVFPRAVSCIFIFFRRYFWSSRIFKGFAFISIGMNLYKLRINRYIVAIAFIISSSALVLMNEQTSIIAYEIKAISLMIGSASLFLMILWLNIESLNKKSKQMRKISTVVYFIHMYVWTIYYMVIYKTKTYGMDSFIIVSVISIMIGYFYTRWKEHKNNKRSQS